MKKTVLSAVLVLMIAASLVSCKSKTNETAGAPAESAAIANPMVETDEAGFVEKTGISLKVPKGATNVKYFVIDNTLGEMRFTLDGMEFTARAKSTAAFEDISGMYYTWDVEDDAKVDRCEAKCRRHIGSDKTIDVICWFDAAPGISYSLSTEGKDLDGFDIIAIAEQVFEPMQGEAG